MDIRLVFLISRVNRQLNTLEPKCFTVPMKVYVNPAKVTGLSRSGVIQILRQAFPIYTCVVRWDPRSGHCSRSIKVVQEYGISRNKLFCNNYPVGNN